MIKLFDSFSFSEARMVRKNPFYTGKVVFPKNGSTNLVEFDDGTAIINSAGAGSGTGSTLAGLSDVTITAAAAGDFLIHNGVDWVDQAISGDVTITAGTSAITGDSIINADIKTTAAIAWSKLATSTDITTAGKVNDLTITGEVIGNVLQFDGTNWVRIANGTAGQALITGGVGVASYWGAPAIATASVLANATTCEAGASDYTLQFGVAGGAYNLTVPAVGGHRTFAFLEEAQAFTAAQTFANEGIHILDTDATHDLVLKAGSNLTGDRILTITTGDAARTVTLTGNLAMSGAFDLTLTTTAGTNVTLPTTGTLATLAGVETLSNKVLTLPQINDTSADHQYVFAVSELAADRNVTLPLLAGDDTFVFANFIQTLTNKTLTGNACTGLVYAIGGNAITFQNAVHTVIGRDTTDTLTNKTIDCDGTGNVITNVSGSEVDPIAVPATEAAVQTLPIVFMGYVNNEVGAVKMLDSAPFKMRLIRAWSINESADGGTWKLQNNTPADITNVVTVAASDLDVDEATQIDSAQATIGVGEDLYVSASNTLDAYIFAEFIRID
jgi:hypothetical protein